MFQSPNRSRERVNHATIVLVKKWHGPVSRFGSRDFFRPVRFLRHVSISFRLFDSSPVVRSRAHFFRYLSGRVKGIGIFFDSRGRRWRRRYLSAGIEMNLENEKVENVPLPRFSTRPQHCFAKSTRPANRENGRGCILGEVPAQSLAWISPVFCTILVFPSLFFVLFCSIIVLT